MNYNKEISLNKLASQFGFSYVYLSRMFKEKTGMNITQYLNSIRINHAYIDILNTTDSILSISYRHGFKNINSFYREFKKQYNNSPLEIRRLNNDIK
ncbi:AraC family transcriptional regulator [uncultured Clostridium sp.]|uniref:helix-turn-helix domain-containing protein n=1 Tax=uncultured Clostridium sp. TaxID=59620 RepID=UPI0025E3BE58|nr:AraC family transcriptional regulator [uncultured Clostridium sp.]